jgi:hypothetical protein
VEFYSKKTRKLWIWIAIDRFAGKTRFNKIIDFLTLSRKDESLAVIVKKEKKTNKELTKILTQKHEPLWIPSRRSFFIIASFVFIFALLSHPQIIVEYFINPFSYLFNYLFGGFTYYQNIKEFLLNLPTINIPSINTEHNHYQNFIAIHAGIGAVLVGLAFFVAQSLIDKNDPDKGRVLLYKSHFFPLLTAEILIF